MAFGTLRGSAGAKRVTRSLWRIGWSAAAALAVTACSGGTQQSGAQQSAQAASQQVAFTPPPATQPVVLITGSTDGLGRELALRIAATGAHVIVHGRNAERGNEVVREIRAAGRGSARFIAADLGSFEQVRRLASTVSSDYTRLDILINNAGIWERTSTSRNLSADGHELSFAVNYLSGFLLTHLLKPMLVKSAPARIVNVASRTQTPIDLDDPMMDRNYSGQRGYGQSKLAQVMFTFDLARELAGTGVVVNAVHPASQMDTEMVRNAGNVPRSTVAQGADAVMNVVNAPPTVTGEFYIEMELGRANAQAYDEQARARLREISVRLTGVGGGGS